MARIRKFDFTNVESYQRCEEGRHVVKLVAIDEVATQAGDDMLSLTFQVVSGDSKGARVFDNCVLTDKALWKFKQVLEALGIDCEKKVVSYDLDKLIGKQCEIEVVHDDSYDGKIRAKIDSYYQLKKNKNVDIEMDDEDIDDFDDEEEEEEKPRKKSKKPVKEEPEDEDDEEEGEEAPPKRRRGRPAKKPEAPKNKASKPAKKPSIDEDEWDDDEDEEDED